MFPIAASKISVPDAGSGSSDIKPLASAKASSAAQSAAVTATAAPLP